MKQKILRWASVATLTLLTSCGEQGPGEQNAGPCQPLAAVACACADGSPGAATCNASGVGIGICEHEEAAV